MQKLQEKRFSIYLPAPYLIKFLHVVIYLDKYYVSRLLRYSLSFLGKAVKKPTNASSQIATVFLLIRGIGIPQNLCFISIQFYI